MLSLHFLGLAMGLGTSFAHMFLSKVVSKMEKDEAIKFRMHTMALSTMGHIGLTLLIASGLYLITPYWNTLSSNPLLIIKLILVVVLIILISFITSGVKKASNGNAAENLKKIEPLGKLTLILGVAIIILAVYIFH